MEIINSILSWINDNVAVVVSGLALSFTIWFSIQNRRLANDKMRKELFTEFNSRYDALNDFLEQITQSSSLEELKQKNLEEYEVLRCKLNDYFNLCAEEYYWRKKRRIDKTIWKSWQAGMNSWYNKHQIIREAWKEEYESFGYQSFYLEKGEQFFKKY
ncbi:hypothetical protein [Leeuwenhoekiella sp. UBA6783]|uniref:hypothetical protein n=1 Tax=Leeuwenhoekiella sp. UBA6783 TaxID=1946747 RepID=UPI0025BE0ED3|nr:hypothetical protein [Leeuwenhoekiella sp. UBA6783]|tara:strand:- start:268 stop:741 length:474 start_codon:yes stop_codon:yes gene_type:complete